MDKKGIKVELKGPNEGVLQALLADAIEYGGFWVEDDQVVKLDRKGDKGDEGDDDGDDGAEKDKKGKKDDDDKEDKKQDKEDDEVDSKGSYKYDFDLGLTLESAKGPGIRLIAAATDKEGNTSDVEEVFPTKAPAAKLAFADAPEAEVGDYVFGVAQNFPNPFNPTTMVRYTLPEASDVRLVIYNVLGQQVRVLVNRMQTRGVHAVQWDGHDAIGRQVATGLYLYRLQAGENVAVKKMVFAK